MPKGLRVLIVEDEVLIAEELQNRLTRLGFHVVGTADTGERAIQAAERLRPGLILMDVRLKGPMDGIRAADGIRVAAARKERDSAPVVFLTAHSDQETLDRAMGAEPFGYLTKPCDEMDLVVGIQMALNRHNVEKRQRENELRHVATLVSMGEGVITADPAGRVTFLNDAAKALTGWSLAEVKGTPVNDIFSLCEEDSVAPVENPIWEALRRGQIIDIDKPVRLRTRTGELILIEGSAALIIANDGRRLGAVVAFRDIRQRRLDEAAAKEVHEKTHQRQKLEAVSLLSGGMAHNFNSLLTVINGYSEMLLEDDVLNEATRKALAEIYEAGQRAGRLTRRLAAFARKQILQPVQCDLGRIVADSTRALGRLFPGDMSVTMSCAPDLWMIHADPGQIEQVIMNLAANAHAAMPHGGLLRLETRNVELTADMLQSSPDVRPGRYVLLEVRDTGTGMNQAVLSRVFEPFFAGTGIGTGTGLGLPMVYGIVTQSGGFIDLSSKLGKGTTFKIYFPALAVPAPAPA